MLLRAKAGRTPPVLAAFREDGDRGRSRRQTALPTLHAPLPKRQPGARLGPGHVDGAPLGRRLLLRGHRRPKRCGAGLTPRPSQASRIAGICRAATWRWHVAWRLTAWTASAHVLAFATANPARGEGLMGTARAAAALTRFLAHRPQRLAEVPRATGQVARGAWHGFGDLVEAWKRGDGAGWYAALEAAILSLACHAQRAHPKRARQTGRAPLGLEPCCENAEVIEFAEAA